MMEAEGAPNQILRDLVDSARRQIGEESMSSHSIHLLNCLGENPAIDLVKLRSLAFLGISDEIQGLRPVIWRLLLNQWPTDTSQWAEIQAAQRDQYSLWCEELIVKPATLKTSAQEHPLATNQDSKWKQYHDDQRIHDEIEKDVKRTRVELCFFYMAVDPSRKTQADVLRLEK